MTSRRHCSAAFQDVVDTVGNAWDRFGTLTQLWTGPLPQLPRDGERTQTSDAHQDPPESEFRVDTAVRIHGLEADAELNDMTGRVDRFDPQRCLWHVRLENGQVIGFKAANLLNQTTGRRQSLAEALLTFNKVATVESAEMLAELLDQSDAQRLLGKMDEPMLESKAQPGKKSASSSMHQSDGDDFRLSPVQDRLHAWHESGDDNVHASTSSKSQPAIGLRDIAQQESRSKKEPKDIDAMCAATSGISPDISVRHFTDECQHTKQRSASASSSQPFVLSLDATIQPQASPAAVALQHAQPPAATTMTPAAIATQWLNGAEAKGGKMAGCLHSRCGKGQSRTPQSVEPLGLLMVACAFPVSSVGFAPAFHAPSPTSQDRIPTVEEAAWRREDQQTKAQRRREKKKEQLKAIKSQLQSMSSSSCASSSSGTASASTARTVSLVDHRLPATLRSDEHLHFMGSRSSETYLEDDWLDHPGNRVIQECARSEEADWPDTDDSNQ